MNKKLTRYDILISLSFVFSLVVGVGAFFYGLQTGKEQTDLKYREFMVQLQEEQNKHQVAYHQQQLVSFYHTVLLPFRDFQRVWFEQLDVLEANGKASDSSAILDQISRLANEQYIIIEPSTDLDISPLLVNAHRNYLKSLKLFAEAADRLKGRSGEGALAAEQIRQDAYVQEAYAFALQAQRQYFDAILEWSKQDQPPLPGIDSLDSPEVTFDQWRGWTLNTKNAYIARMLLDEGVMHPFYPQDIASRIDDLDATGRAVKLKLTTIRQASQMLLSTGGVRTGDYLRLKDKIYKGERLPQLPFFSD